MQRSNTMITPEQMQKAQRKARESEDAGAGEPEKSFGEIVEDWEGNVRAEAADNSGVVHTVLSPFFEDHKRLVRLPDVKPSAAASDTEALLNGLIEDCRFLIREVAFHSARLTPDANHRMQFLDSAKALAVTGAKVGRTIAKLRQDKPPEPEENRYRMIIEHVQNPPVRATARKVPVRRGGEGVKKAR
jgi:hypothetical protein